MITAERPWATKTTYTASEPLPSFASLPRKYNLPCAWSVWGPGDQLGTINLLTPSLVASAAHREIQSGTYVSLNLPLQIPAKPSFHRKQPDIKLIGLPGYDPDVVPVRDDEVHMNSQSGTQWDGLRHFGVVEGKCFYGGVPAEEIKTGTLKLDDPLAIDPKDLQLSMHHWASHGICGRGVLLDLVAWYTREGKPLPYDPCTTHGIPLSDLKACAESQNVKFETGDILILRVGWTRRYLYESTSEEKATWGLGGNETFAGVENTEEMKEWLWDNHFAAVASDQPAFEAWPPKEGQVHLHSTIIGMYGSPIGEFFDTERLSEVAHSLGRFSFFLCSNPLFLLGGAASLANASAIF